jgi:ribonuclease E
MNPRRKKAVKLYQAKGPIFGKHDIEKQLETIYQPTVSLASGAGIVIQSTEALVSVDVNSGKAIRGKQLEETALNVNLEAAVEIARQLRLRDLGGLIVIDFIDMRERKHQRALHKKLKDELKKDKAKTTVGAVSRFGLIEMSRQRIRPPVDFGATQVCPRCQGRGVLLSTEAVGRSVLRNLERKMPRGGRRGLRAFLSPEAAHYLLNNKRAELARLEQRSGACLEVVADPELTGEQMRLTELTQGWSLPCASGAESAGRDKAEPPAQTPAKDKPRNRKRPPAGSRAKAPAKPPAKAQDKAPAKTPAKAPEPDGEPARAENEPASKPPKRRSRRRRSGASRRRAKARRAARNGPETPDKSQDQPRGPQVGPEPQDN